MATITIDLTSLVKWSAGVDPELPGLIASSIQTLQAWTADQLAQWKALVLSDSEAAKQQLIDAMNAAASTAGGQAAADQYAADTQANLAGIAKWRTLGKELWDIVLAILAGLVTVTL